MKKNVKRLATAAVIAVAIGAFLAGCGGSGKSSTTTTGSGTLSGSIK